MNIDLLMNGQAEAVSLSEKGMTITEYLYSFTSSDDAPATMMVNTANGDLIRESLSTAPDELSQNDVSNPSSPQMVININDMLTDNDVLLFRAKPKTQGVGVGEALQELISSQLGVSAEFLGQEAEPSMQAEVDRKVVESEAFWAKTSQRNNLMRKVDSPYRDGDWFESCKPDDHD